MDEDWGVVERVLDGEVNAFALLVRKYEDRLYRLAANMIHDRSQARDIVQDAFFSAYRKLSSFDPDLGSFATWIFRITRNACLNHIARTKRHVECDFDALPGASDTEADLARREVFAALDKAVAGLDSKDKTVFVMAEIEGLPLAEIASIEGAKLGTIKSRLSRTRDKLAKILARRLG